MCTDSKNNRVENGVETSELKVNDLKIVEEVDELIRKYYQQLRGESRNLFELEKSIAEIVWTLRYRHNGLSQVVKISMEKCLENDKRDLLLK